MNILPKLACAFFLATLITTVQADNLANDNKISNPSTTPDNVIHYSSIESIDDALAELVNLADDPRIKNWDALAKAGNATTLITQTEADLLSESPHPYASYVWSWAHWSQGTLTVDRIPSIPDNLKQVLEVASKAFVYKRMDYRESFIPLIPEIIDTAKLNYWALYDAYKAVERMDRSDEAETLAKAALTTFPQDYIFARGINWDSHKENRALLDWIGQTPSIASSAGGRLLLWRLEQSPKYTIDWLSLHQRVSTYLPMGSGVTDVAYNLENIGQFEKALEYLSKPRPFKIFRAVNAISASTILAKLRRFDEARVAAVAHVEVSEPPNFQKTEAARRKLVAFSDAGEMGYAREAGLEGVEAGVKDDKMLIA